MRSFREFIEEEAPANAIGGGNIAGAGVGPYGEPGFSKKAMNKYKRKNRKDVMNALIKRWSM